MADVDVDALLKEADELGILNIDVDKSQITPEIIRIAIAATKRLNGKLDRDSIIKKIQETEPECAIASVQ